jgi:hypothetical protein
MGGKFTLSDDSHCVGHVCTNYAQTMDFLEGLGVKEVYVLERHEDSSSSQKSELVCVPVELSVVKAGLVCF